MDRLEYTKALPLQVFNVKIPHIRLFLGRPNGFSIMIMTVFISGYDDYLSLTYMFCPISCVSLSTMVFKADIVIIYNFVSTPFPLALTTVIRHQGCCYSRPITGLRMAWGGGGFIMVTADEDDYCFLLSPHRDHLLDYIGLGS